MAGRCKKSLQVYKFTSLQVYTFTSLQVYKFTSLQVYKFTCIYEVHSRYIWLPLQSVKDYRTSSIYTL